ncbi:hypothetical protein JNW90_13265 [Micromonospora sp. STR1s_5]|nr:hypothetical protein [Micromonospora sp. STR1s_5]
MRPEPEWDNLTPRELAIAAAISARRTAKRVARLEILSLVIAGLLVVIVTRLLD